MRFIKRCLLAAVLFIVAASVSFAQQRDVTGKVTITYTLSRLSGIASNQFAVWIENDRGVFVQSLFVTKFTGGRAGWKNRPACLPAWREAAKVSTLPQKEVDAVSGPTPRSGTYDLVWDLKDSKGNTVPAGSYRFRAEANLFWENRTLWTGSIVIGGTPQTAHAETSYSPPEASERKQLITSVKAIYTPKSSD